MTDARRIDHTDESAEYWERVYDSARENSPEHWMHMVASFRPYDPDGLVDDWRVHIHIAEWVRDEPQRDLFTQGLAAVISRVARVTRVWQEDTEQWVAEGSPSGRDLVIAAADFVDAFIDIEYEYLEQFLS